MALRPAKEFRTEAVRITLLSGHSRLCKSAQSQILLGLCGTGETVLLNRIEGLAEAWDYLTSLV